MTTFLYIYIYLRCAYVCSYSSYFKVELSSPSAELRILEVFYNKIYKFIVVNTPERLQLFILIVRLLNSAYWQCRYFRSTKKLKLLMTSIGHYGLKRHIS